MMTWLISDRVIPVTFSPPGMLLIATANMPSIRQPINQSNQINTVHHTKFIVMSLS